MKTNSVRQPAHGKVNSRDVHEALVHSKKQAKPVTGPEHFTVREEKTANVRSGRTQMRPLATAGTENIVPNEGPSSLNSDNKLRSFPGKVVLSQYETLKSGWVDFFLKRDRWK